MKKDLIQISDAPTEWRLNLTVQKLLRGLRKGKWIAPNAVVVLNLSCVDGKTMARLNKKYRRKNGPTDVLSFEQPDAGTKKLVLLGDLVLCCEIIRTQAKELAHSTRDEAAVITAHGLLHLLGYDHERSARDLRKQAMAEAKLLKLSGFTALAKTALIERTKFDKT